MLRTVDYIPADDIERAVIFLHGYGSNGSDYSSMIQTLADRFPNTAFYCPDAPEVVEFSSDGVYQWYPIEGYNPDELKRNIDQMKYVFSEYTALAEKSRIELDVLIESVAAKHFLPADKIALLGFSQGGLMAVLTALMYPETLGPVVSFSGMSAVINRDLAIRVSPPVMLIHGGSDAIVPSDAVDISTRMLVNFGIAPEVAIIPNMGHEINDEALNKAISFLKENFNQTINHGS